MDIACNLTTETVERALSADPLCVEPQTTLREVFALMKEQNAPSVLVCEEGRLVGIFTERDALKLMAGRAPAVDWQAPIERHMVRQPVSVRRSVSIAAAIQLMSSGGYRRLPVVDADDRPVGMIQVASIVHYLVEHFPSAVYNQPPVAHPVTHDREGS